MFPSTWLSPLQACACLLLMSCSGGDLSRSGNPRDGLDVAGAASAFPDSLRHWSGAMAPRDKARLLLHVQASRSREDWARRLASTGLEMEPDPQGASGVTVLHTGTEIWVRSRDGNPLDEPALRRVGGILGPELGWAGAVFLAPGTDSSVPALDSLRRLYCAFPHSLRVFPAPGFADPSRLPELAAALAPYDLEPSRAAPTGDSGSHGLDLRWIGEPEGNVYRLADSLAAWEPAAVRGTALENAPMLAPR